MSTIEQSCPFCGSLELVSGMDDEGLGMAVLCLVCQADGPFVPCSEGADREELRQKAIDLFGRRAQVSFTDEELDELRKFVSDIQSNPFASGEIQAMGGVRVVLSDEVLTKLGFELGPISPRVAAMRAMDKASG
jgi:hypothetical protein